jgi:DNA-binding LacI/PurR family transcriptional regulator
MGRRAGSAPTMHDVARVAGVSLKTVSNVVNEHPQVGAAIRERVRAAIEELGYRPNISARNLRSGRSGVIGLAVPVLSQAYFAQLADDVIRAAEARGLVVLVEQTGGVRERELELLGSPRLALIDGLLFSPLGLTVGDVPDVTPGMPLVVLGEHLFGGSVDNITMQNQDAARAATAHLLGKGRRRIAVIGEHKFEVETTAGLRMAGYRAALADAGVPFDDALVAPIEVWDRTSGAEAMQRLLDTGVRPDGVFAMNDDLALGALRVLSDRGLEVPDDVAVIGFDDVDECRYSAPRLSSVDPGRREIAAMAVDLLMERVAAGAHHDDLPPRERAPKARLALRESTGD